MLTPKFLSPAGSPLAVQFSPERALIWTFAGGRINRTLQYIFSLLGGFEVTSDNFQLRIVGDSLTHEAINEVIVRMREPGFWSDRLVLEGMMAELPEYRLSKFQRAMPTLFSEEIVMNYLLDFDGAKRFVGLPASNANQE